MVLNHFKELMWFGTLVSFSFSFPFRSVNESGFPKSLKEFLIAVISLSSISSTWIAFNIHLTSSCRPTIHYTSMYNIVCIWICLCGVQCVQCAMCNECILRDLPDFRIHTQILTGKNKIVKFSVPRSAFSAVSFAHIMFNYPCKWHQFIQCSSFGNVIISHNMDGICVGALVHFTGFSPKKHFRQKVINFHRNCYDLPLMGSISRRRRWSNHYYYFRAWLQWLQYCIQYYIVHCTACSWHIRSVVFGCWMQIVRTAEITFMNIAALMANFGFEISQFRS